MNKEVKAAVELFRANDTPEAAEVEFLRRAVRYFNSRPEQHNEGKTVSALLTEFAKAVNAGQA